MRRLKSIPRERKSGQHLGEAPRDQDQKTIKIPAMTPEIAATFAQLLYVGCPVIRAVLYLFPNLSMDTAAGLARKWMVHPSVRKANEDLIGGNWLFLPMDRRMELALDKHLAEMAFYLHTSNYNEAEDRETLEKMRMAREVLTSRVKPETLSSNPLDAFTRFAMDVLRMQQAERASQSQSAPQEQGDTLDQFTNQMELLTTPPANKEPM